MTTPKKPGGGESPAASPPRDRLLTSSDLFGDMVDAPAEPASAPPHAARQGPIRVQVSEPHAEGVSPRAGPLPEEVAALLEVLGGAVREPTASAGSPPPGPAPSGAAPEELGEDEPLAPDLPPVSADEPTDPEPVFDLTPVDAGARAVSEPAARASVPESPEEEGLDLGAVAQHAFEAATQEPATAAPGGAGGTGQAREPGRMYGPYRLLARIAVGGMAEVFKAKRAGVEGFEKVLAVKRILRHLSENKQFVEMFVDEAKIVSGLTHPNIVQIHDLGKIEKSYYIAMEYVHGRDLRTILRRARERGLRLPLDLSILIVIKVCSALEYAHRKRDDRGAPLMIAHRDISPQNILISFEGDVKLTDFGIAKAAARATETDKGALRGKLLYMSPEQASGKPMDGRSDIFSLGLVFYEMLTEHKPFAAGSETSILERVRECRIAPPSTLNARVPEKLERVVMQALQRDPEMRYQNASEMYRDLDRILHARKPPAAIELARFLEILFDERERADILPAEVLPEAPAAGEHGGDMEIEFEVPPSVEPRAPAGEIRALHDPMTIQKLLKRFGVK